MRRRRMLWGVPLMAALGTSLATAQLTDHDGHPIVSTPAPVLRFERKSAPTATGIDYPFAEQTAHGVALLSRFPAFALSDCRIHVDGPWYDTEAANLHFTRGIASVGAMPRYRETENAPTSVAKLPPERKWMLMTDPLWWASALRLADDLSRADPADPRIAGLRTFGEGHRFSDSEAAFRALGRHVFDMERWSTDSQGRFVGFPSIDIEGTEAFEFQRRCNGWLYQGMCDAAREAGFNAAPVLYGQWQFSVGCFWESMRQGGTGDPEYLLPEKDFIAEPDPTLAACQEHHGILSMDGYQQAIWGNEPFLKRGADGKLDLGDGQPVFSDATATTAYGWPLRLEPGEARQCLDNLYRAALRMYLQHHRLAGQYPASSMMRKAFLTNCRVGAWSRYTNEGLQGIEQNDRPLPPWLLETLIGMYLFTADDVVLWSSDMNFIPGPLGGDYTSAWRYNAHGVLETVVKAAHRHSALDSLHATGAPFQWCWFNLPVVNKNETPGDRYIEKPIAMGKLRPFEGHTYLELFVAWPAIDDQAQQLEVWVEKEGKRSPTYTIRLRNGRTYFLDAWQLPDSFRGLEGRDIWLRARDQLGTLHVWRGDWRAAVDEPR